MTAIFTLRYFYSHQHSDQTFEIFLTVILMCPSQIWLKHFLYVEILYSKIGIVNYN